MAARRKTQRRRRRRLPWHVRFYRSHRQMCAVGFALGGIVIVQVYFSTHVDKDEYQRIMGNLVTFGVSALLMRR